jgi:hypothetical protein
MGWASLGRMIQSAYTQATLDVLPPEWSTVEKSGLRSNPDNEPNRDCVNNRILGLRWAGQNQLGKSVWRAKGQVTLFDRTIEGRISRLRLGLICCVVAAVSSVVAVAGGKAVGYSFPNHFLLFILLSLAYCFCFLFWLLRRLRKQSN